MAKTLNIIATNATVFALFYLSKPLYMCKFFLEIGATECPAPTHPKNGNALVSASFTEYHCFKGYALKGIRRLVCSDDGIWRGVPPVCLSKKWAIDIAC